LQIIPEARTAGPTNPPALNEQAADGEDPETGEDPALENQQTALAETESVEEETPPEDANEQDPGPATSTMNDGEETVVAGAETINDTSVTFVPQEVLQGALSLRKLRPSINQLYYQPSDGLSFQDDRGWRVYFGTGIDMNQKLVIYETILEDLLTRGINPRYISVSNKSKPYYSAQ
jgi:hypothetical protein